MNRYDLTQLIKLWEREKITTEQAIGQILLHLQEQTERILRLEQSGRSDGRR